jgi:ribosome-associated protein
MALMPQDNIDADVQIDGPSKSARKRDATALQDLGVELAALPEQTLLALELPETLRDAVMELRRLIGHGARLRQQQYIGKLMRKIDAEPIRAQLELRKHTHDADVRRLRAAEAWRQRLLSGEASALDEFMLAYPAAERGALTRLCASAAAQQSRGQAPSAARELFRLLRALI